VSASHHPQPEPQARQGWQTPPGVPHTGLLDLLVADAAGQAAAILAGSATQTQDPLIDAVRLLAYPSGPPHTARAAQLTGIPADELRRLTLAYRHGGTAAVSATLEATPCDADQMSAAVDEVRRRRTFAAGDLSSDSGTITDTGAGIRLRLGPDGRWHPFTLARQQWWPAGGTNPCAGLAYQAAVRARSARRANG
jgi:hypothetical protein